MDKFICPSKIKSCTDLILYFLDLNGGITTSLYEETFLRMYALDHDLIRQTTYFDGKKYKEIVIFENGLTHLKIFNKKEQELYYRDSNGIQIIFDVEKDETSKIRYLDDCVICKKNIEVIFNTLYP